MKSDLRERCLSEAMAVIAEGGVSGLSLRDIARRLSVSHQAPYKHFRSRDHLLAEAIGRTYELLGYSIEARPRRDRPDEDLGEIGRAYLRFAKDNPLHYRLLFEYPLSELAAFEGVEAKAAIAFEHVLVAVQRLTGSEDETLNRECALFAWSCVHGLSSLSANQILPAAGYFSSIDRSVAIESAMAMICAAIMTRSEGA
jgi:AcrR family transcriptional regulator